MSLPVLVVTGALGTGKTTLINRLLAGDHGRRIAAIVNDFGSINIDADLIAGSTEEGVGLRNGCICCTLQGDLLRTLKILFDQDPRPEMIVIEASGVADPAGIVEALYDPVIFSHAALEAVVCVLDAEALADDPKIAEDDLWQAQLAGADMVVLSKAAGLAGDQLARIHTRLGAGGHRQVIDPERDTSDLEMLLLEPETIRSAAGPRIAGQKPRVVDAGRFATVEWVVDRAISLPRFQAAMQQIAPGLLRAKGFLRTQEHPGQQLIFQLVGRRAAVSQGDPAGPEGCRLVLIGRAGEFDAEGAREVLDLC